MRGDVWAMNAAMERSSLSTRRMPAVGMGGGVGPVGRAAGSAAAPAVCGTDCVWAPSSLGFAGSGRAGGTTVVLGPVPALPPPSASKVRDSATPTWGDLPLSKPPCTYTNSRYTAGLVSSGYSPSPRSHTHRRLGRATRPSRRSSWLQTEYVSVRHVPRPGTTYQRRQAPRS